MNEGKIRIIMFIWMLMLMGGAFLLLNGMPSETPPEETAIETTAETEPEIVHPALPVSETEEKLLSRLYGAMKSEDAASAAAALNEQEEGFKKLAQETLGGDKYLYYEKEISGETVAYMERLSDSLEGEGLVLARNNTAFFGHFQNGMPEGSGLAVQAMVIEEPRYTFAKGKFSSGKLNGEGETGYFYYKKVPEGSYAGIRKIGHYQDNLLDGAFVCEAKNAKGETFCWDMEASAGVTVLTDHWKYSKIAEEYLLSARDNPERTYVLEKSRADMVLWNNLIEWDE